MVRRKPRAEPSRATSYELRATNGEWHSQIEIRHSVAPVPWVVASGVFGRTNLEVPPVWLSLAVPHERVGDWREELVAAALAAQVPIDITSGPTLWGGAMRATDAFLTIAGNSDFERANDTTHAFDLLQAHLIQTLSSIGREHIDIYFLRVRRAVEEYQITGALEALEHAKQEGHIRFIGLYCDGPGLAALGTWQFHDAFEVLRVRRNHYDHDAFDTLEPMARERRVGIVTSDPLEWGYGMPFPLLPNVDATLGGEAISDLAQRHPVLVNVRTVDEVRGAIAAGGTFPPADLPSRLAPLTAAWDDVRTWQSLADSTDGQVRGAVELRAREVLR